MKWDKVKLEDVSTIIAGQSPESKYYNQTGHGLPFFQGKADFGLETPNIRYWCTEPTKIAQPLDILLSVRAPVGPTNICNIESCIGRGLAAVRVGKKLNYRYLYWWFKSFEKKLSSMGNGSTFSAITTKVVKDLEVPLPPLHIQEQIAFTLDKADALRRKDQELLTKYDELAQSLFNASVINNVRFVLLTEVTNKITDGVHFKPDYKESGIPFISVKNITKKFLDTSDCKYVSKEDHEVMIKRCKPEFGDILYTKVGATYGRAAVVDIREGFSLYVSVCLIKPKKELIRTDFLHFVMNSNLVKDQADRSIKGAGVPDLHLVEIIKFSIPLPSLELQDKFCAQIKLLNESKKRITELSSNIFDSLSNKYFS